jgi:hypothetical protein
MKPTSPVSSIKSTVPAKSFPLSIKKSAPIVSAKALLS